MAQDTYVQLAPNSTGEKVAMDRAVDAAGNSVVVQKALLTGETADLLKELLETQQAVLLVLQTMLANDQQFYSVLGTFGVIAPPVVSLDDVRNNNS